MLNSNCFMPKNKPMFNREHYVKLIDCARRGRQKEWNDWRRAKPDEKILLEGAQFKDISLEYFDLSKVHIKKSIFICVNLGEANFSRANLEETIFECSTLESTNFCRANLTKARFNSRPNMKKAKFLLANLDSANLSGANLSEADLIKADLLGSFLRGTCFDGACLRNAVLKKAQAYDSSFVGAELKGANLEFALLLRSNLARADLSRASLIKAGLDNADLREATLEHSDLRSANLDHAKVTETTSLWRCFLDRRTSMEGVPLGSVKVDTGTKQLLEYNLRRRSWEGWCRGHKIVGRPLRLFWLCSDYGLSTKHILAAFFITAMLFASVYWILAFAFPPGVISNLTVDAAGEPIPKSMMVLRSIYFSIVTMTTLGFGDMYAEAGSWIGYMLLILQVVLGYVMLGAVITRFSILFTGCGPAGWHFPDFVEGKSESHYWPEERLIKLMQERNAEPSSGNILQASGDRSTQTGAIRYGP